MLQPFTYHLGNLEIKSTQGSYILENGIVTLHQSESSWPTILVVRGKGMADEIAIWQGDDKWWVFTYIGDMVLEHVSDGGIAPTLEFYAVKKNGVVVHKA